MIVKPIYSRYQERLFKGLSRVIIICIAWSIFALFQDIRNIGVYISLGIFGALVLTLTISVLKKSKSYLGEIRFGKEECEFHIVEFDNPKEIIKTKTSETRIKIWELFFPFTKFGRNYKLIIETKQGLTYKRIIQQYEIGNWNLEKFKETIEVYGKFKGNQATTASFTRGNFNTSDE